MLTGPSARSWRAGPATISSGVITGLRRRVGRSDAPQPASSAFDRLPPHRRVVDRLRRASRPSRSSCSTSAATSSSVAWTLSMHRPRQRWARSASAVARRHRAGPLRRGPLRAPAGPRGCDLPARRTGRAAAATVVGDPDLVRAARRTCAGPRPACASAAAMRLELGSRCDLRAASSSRRCRARCSSSRAASSRR